jgi:hypothetical protein
MCEPPYAGRTYVVSALCELSMCLAPYVLSSLCGEPPMC